MMLLASLAFAAVCAVLLVIPLAFIFHDVYEDGFFGRAGLGGVAFTSALHLLVWFDAEAWPLFPFWDVVALFVIQSACFAVFLVWHLFRFHGRVLRTQRKTESVA